MHTYGLSERQNNHYHNLFNHMNPIPLSVSEHTAQLTKSEAFSVQHKFINGEINMLSCTTTFEMGVDVGDLQCVLMRNMPPNPGNYVQRAYFTESCHPFHVKAATRNAAKLPPPGA